jgi:hypothetical protein
MLKRAYRISDLIHTHEDLAKRLINYFQPCGWVLDPCRGGGVFYDNLPKTCRKFWCEILEGRNFHDWKTPVDWIFTNPPWSIHAYREISRHAFSLANNVMFLIRLFNALGTIARHRDFTERGHALKEIVVVPWEDSGFPDEGYVLAACHWQRGWSGGTKWTYWI